MARRWHRLTALSFAAALGSAGCGTEEEFSDDPGTESVEEITAAQRRLLGAWRGTQVFTAIVFENTARGRGLAYFADRLTTCSAPPCATTRESGSFTATSTRITLTRTGAAAEAYSYTMPGGRLSLRRVGGTARATLSRAASYCAAPADCAGQSLTASSCRGAWACSAESTCAYECGACPSGQSLCAERCVDTDANEAHCGACGRACTAAQTCDAGECRADENRRVIELVNESRAIARTCGTTAMPAVGRLVWSDRIAAAALAHSRDMAENRFLSHTGSDNSDLTVRFARAGYFPSGLAENIAAGQRTPEEVVAAWLRSPGHCTNIMRAWANEAAASVVNSDDRFGRYWTLDFGRE